MVYNIYIIISKYYYIYIYILYIYILNISHSTACSIDGCNRNTTPIQPHLLSSCNKAIEMKLSPGQENVKYIKHRKHFSCYEYLFSDGMLCSKCKLYS